MNRLHIIPWKTRFAKSTNDCNIYVVLKNISDLNDIGMCIRLMKIFIVMFNMSLVTLFHQLFHYVVLHII